MAVPLADFDSCKRVKFLGKFRELKPAGYEFNKLYARNYRCYHKEFEFGQWLTIWQHRGGYVEVEDFYCRSYLIINAIISKEGLPVDENGYFAIDKVNNTIEANDNEKHSTVKFHMWNQGDMGIQTKTDKGEAYKAHCDRWRVDKIADGLIEEVKRIHNLGWIAYTN